MSRLVTALIVVVALIAAYLGVAKWRSLWPWTKRGCPHGCSGNGKCSGDTCNCSVGWFGSDCSKRICAKECGTGGTCKIGATPADDSCTCSAGRYGSDCSESCAKDCGADGTCSKEANGTQFCTCDAGFRGTSCGHKAYGAACASDSDCGPGPEGWNAAACVDGGCSYMLGTSSSGVDWKGGLGSACSSSLACRGGYRCAVDAPGSKGGKCAKIVPLSESSTAVYLTLK